MDLNKLKKAKEIEAEINLLKGKAEHFTNREPQGKYDKVYKKGFYHLKGLFKENKTNINITPFGYFGGGSIEVDEEFLKYCRVYFDGKIEEKEEELKQL